MMLTSFQKLCIRPELGFAYDKGAMVDVPDGGSFTELLCKVTSKCDTSILLLSSHKGKIRDFAIKLVGLHSPQSTSSSVTSAVLSGFKKGFSYLNGKGGNTNQQQVLLTEEEQVSEAWEECETSGYHGMQVIALLDKEMMPDNDCRKLYNLHHFMTSILQSINAYYMFQKTDVAFVYDEGFNTERLMESYPNADTFGIAIIWRFAENPAAITGRIRPTPIVRKSVHSETVPSPRPLRSLLDTSQSVSSRSKLSKSFIDIPRPLTTVSSTTVTTTKKKVTELRDGSVVVHKTVEESKPTVRSFTTPLVESAEEEEESDYEDVDGDDSEEEITTRKTTTRTISTTPVASNNLADKSPVRIAAATKIPSPFNIRGVVPPENHLSPVVCRAIIPAHVSPVIADDQPRQNLVTSTRRGGRVVAAAAVDDQRPTVRRARGTPQKQLVAPIRQVVTPRSRSKRKFVEEEEEEEEDLPQMESTSFRARDDEISFRAPKKLATEPCPMEVEDTADSITNTTFDPNSITLSFDDAPSKPRGGRKSMAARKSLANEWPSEDQQHMLHFFDNLNPGNSETSRVALSCKYALIQYDRDLSSKLLYTWLERKGRPSQRDQTNYTLQEAEQKDTVLALYRSLSSVQSESTRASFTLKFMQTQYGVAVTSKQLFIWLKEKAKKTKK